MMRKMKMLLLLSWKGLGLLPAMALTFRMDNIVVEAEETTRGNNDKDGDENRLPVRSSSRMERFPSVEERVKLYMSNWYVPPCDPRTDRFPVWWASSSSSSSSSSMESTERGTVRVANMTIHPKVDADQAFVWTEDVILDCARSEEQYQRDQDRKISLPTEHLVMFRHNMRMYCSDVVEIVDLLAHTTHAATSASTSTWASASASASTGTGTDGTNGTDGTSTAVTKALPPPPPVIMQFGDMKHSHIFGYLNLPHLKKFRSATDALQDVIVVPSQRHNHPDDDPNDDDGQSCFSLSERPSLVTPHTRLTKMDDANGDSDGDDDDEEEADRKVLMMMTKTTTTTMAPSSSSSSSGETGRPFPIYVGKTDFRYQRMQPIVWKLATHRHYKFLPMVQENDTPWSQKLDKAAWRGQLTGALENFRRDRTPEENCHHMKRCRLVWETSHSDLVDAMLTTTRGRLPDVIDDGRVPIVGSKVPISHLMRYKALIMLEGNDVASGLKWALLSQSVVLMPKPRHTSWAMEELLEPWVHYIPLEDDGVDEDEEEEQDDSDDDDDNDNDDADSSPKGHIRGNNININVTTTTSTGTGTGISMAQDVERKMQWIIDHDEEARAISRRATLWMEDLCFHPDAARDDRLIKEEILRRYAAHFDVRS